MIATTEKYPIALSTENLALNAQIERLAALPRYAQLRTDSLARLVEIGEPRVVRVGEALLVEGQPSRSIFIVLSGRLKMARSIPNGRSALLALFGAGDPVGITTLGGRPSDATVSALESSLCLDIPQHALMTTLERYPRLVADLLPVLTEQVSECRFCALEGAFLRVEPRLAKLLLKLDDSLGRRESGTAFIPVALSRQDLADLAGTTIETAIRIMSRWGKEGLVETRDDGFLLHDRDMLAAL